MFQIKRRIELSDHLFFQSAKPIPVIERSDRNPKVIGDPRSHPSITCWIELPASRRREALRQMRPGQPPTPRTIRVVAIGPAPGGFWNEAALYADTGAPRTGIG